VSDPTLVVEVVCAWPERAVVKSLRLASRATVADALDLAQRDERFAGIDFEQAPVGIFGARAERQQRLRDGDRIEIYRALAVDPKSARRARAASARARRA